LKQTLKYSKITRPGCWAYADMLEVGVTESPFIESRKRNYTLSPEENRQHFGAWIIISSPIVLSHDLTDEAKADEVWPLIANPELIAVNQAWYQTAGGVFKNSKDTGLKGVEVPNHFRKWTAGNVRFPRWTYLYKPLGPDKVAVLLMNMGEEPIDLKVDFNEIPGLENGESKLNVRDLFARRDVAHDVSSFTCEQVKGHDCCFLYISTEVWQPGTGEYWNTDYTEGIEIITDTPAEAESESIDVVEDDSEKDKTIIDLQSQVSDLTSELDKMREELRSVQAEKRRQDIPQTVQIAGGGTALPNIEQVQENGRTTFLFQAFLVMAIVGIFLRHLWANRNWVDSKLFWYFIAAFFMMFAFFLATHTYIISIPMIWGTLLDAH